VNLHEVCRYALVVDDELVSDSQSFERRLRSRYERPHLPAVDGGGPDDFGGQLAARERHFDGALVCQVETTADTDVPREHVGVMVTAVLAASARLPDQ
jgi:hypothetical protein